MVLYTQQRSRPECSDYLEPLRSLTTSVISDLDHEDLFPAIAEFLGEILEDYESFFSQRMIMLLAEKLSSPSYQDRVQSLIAGDFGEDLVGYGRLLITYGYAEAEHLLLRCEDALTARVTNTLRGLIGCKGYAIQDDVLISHVLEFWSKYAETALTLKSQNTNAAKPPWLATAENNIRLALEAFLAKIQLPPAHIFQKWDRQNQGEFQALRADFRDLSASAYCLLGSNMLDGLVAYAIRLGQESNWYGVEVTLQCVRGSMEVAEDSEEGYNALAMLFDSPIIGVLGDLGQNIPTSVRQTTMHIVTDCASFFKRNVSSLLSILDFLFRCLEEASLMLTSAKSIAGLCDHCRGELSNHADILTDHYCSFVASMERPAEVKEKLIGGVASVVQAASAASGERSGAPTQANEALSMLLQTVEVDVQKSLLGPSSPDTHGRALAAIACLASIGIAFRRPDSNIIDLEDDSESRLSHNPVHQAAMSIDGARRSIIGIIIRVLGAYPEDGEIMKGVCDIIRAGLTEDIDNPFTVSPDFVAGLLVSYISRTHRVGYLLETVTRFLRKHTASSEDTRALAMHCLQTSLQALNNVKGVCSGIDLRVQQLTRKQKTQGMIQRLHLV